MAQSSTYDKAAWAELTKNSPPYDPAAWARLRAESGASSGSGFWSQAGTLLTGGDGVTWKDLNNSLAKEMPSMGPILSISGAVNSAIGAYYSAKTAQYQLESQSETLKFQSEMSKINQRAAEFQAQTIMQAGERQAGAVGLKYGQMKGAAKTRMAAAGGVIGEGSNREIIASSDLMKEIDMLTINANTVRAAEAARTQSVNYGNQALLQGVSAGNLASSASSISPLGGAATTLLGGATTLMNAWYQDRKVAAMAARLGIE